MTSIKVRNADGSYSVISTVGPQGPPGPEGPAGPEGPTGPAGPLDILTDVTAPANTPAGKLLGTTAEGVWAPVDPPPAPVTGVRVTVGPIAPTNPNVGDIWIKP